MGYRWKVVDTNKKYWNTYFETKKSAKAYIEKSLAEGKYKGANLEIRPR